MSFPICCRLISRRFFPPTDRLKVWFISFDCHRTAAYTGVRLNWGEGSHRISDPAPLVWDPLPIITDHVPHNWHLAPFCLDPPLCTVCSSIFLCMMLCKNVVVHSHFFICILSMLGVDKCCKCQTLFKCHKWCLECLKTHGRQSGTPPLLSVFRARASALQASRL